MPRPHGASSSVSWGRRQGMGCCFPGAEGPSSSQQPPRLPLAAAPPRTGRPHGHAGAGPPGRAAPSSPARPSGPYRCRQPGAPGPGCGPTPLTCGGSFAVGVSATRGPRLPCWAPAERVWGSTGAVRGEDPGGEGTAGGQQAEGAGGTVAGAGGSREARGLRVGGDKGDRHTAGGQGPGHSGGNAVARGPGPQAAGPDQGGAVRRPLRLWPALQRVPTGSAD